MNQVVDTPLAASKQTIIVVLMLATAALTAFGLSGVDEWARQHDVRRLLIILVFVIVAELVTGKSRFRSVDIALVILAGMFIATGALWPVLAILLFLLSSYVVGYVFLRAIRVSVDHALCESTCLVGVSLFATLVGLMAHFPINYPGVYLFLLLLPLLAWRDVASAAIASLRKTMHSYRHIPYLDTTVVCLAIVHLSIALMPEIWNDALAMHLFVPEHMAHRHQWGFDASTYVWAVMPMQGNWVYTILNMLGGETAARLTNVTMLLIIGSIIHKLVEWAGGDRVGGRMAMILYLATPLTYLESGTLLIESVWTALLLAGVFECLRFLLDSDMDRGSIPLAAILLGSAMATKVIAATVIIPLLILILVCHQKVFRTGHASYLMSGVLLFLLIGGIPYLTAWILTGNPVFPDYNAIFQSEFYPVVNRKDPNIQMGLVWDTLYRMTFEPGIGYLSGPGSAGFHLLLLLFPALVLSLLTRNRRALVLAIVAVVGLAITFVTIATHLRYVFPSYAMFDVLIGVALSVMLRGRVAARYVATMIFLAGVSLNLMFFSKPVSHGYVDSRAVLSESGREAFLESRRSIRNAVSLLNALDVSDQAVAVYAHPMMAGLKYDAIYIGSYNYLLSRLLHSAQNADDVIEVFSRNAMRYLVLDETWGDSSLRALLRSVTDVVSTHGSSISVRVIKDDLLFREELLEDVGFHSEDNWVLHGEAHMIADGVIVNEVSPVMQWVSLSDARKFYKLTVKTRCLDAPAQGRFQIDWHDTDGLMKAESRIFDCATAHPYSTVLLAPNAATHAVVYALGYTGDIIINEISLKK